MRGFHRSYPHQGDRRSARITRFHIIREDGKWGGLQGFCGQRCTDSGDRAWDRGPDSVAVIIDPLPLVPPDGLVWCPACLGHLTQRRGRAHQVAALVVPDAGTELVRTGVLTVCCKSHRRLAPQLILVVDGRPTSPDGMERQAALFGAPGVCCDPQDCGPCCPECPTCPRVQARTPQQRRQDARRCEELIRSLARGWLD